LERKRLGKLGELVALQYLQKHGYQVLERNFKIKSGEIDLIAVEAGDLVFVEVKTRLGLNFGLPEEAVTTRKISHIKKAAFYYRNLHPNLPASLRIDVVSISLSENGLLESIKILKNITG